MPSSRRPVGRRSLRQLIDLVESGDSEAKTELDAITNHLRLAFSGANESITRLAQDMKKNSTALEAAHLAVIPYALLTSAPSSAAVAYNLTNAALDAGEPTKRGADYTRQLSLDEIQTYTPTATALGKLSVDALRVLAIVCGVWRETTHDFRCNSDSGKHADSCTHALDGFTFERTRLAVAVFGKHTGQNLRRLTAALGELTRVEFEWGHLRGGAGGTYESLGEPSPVLIVRRAGTGTTGRGAVKSARRWITLNPHLYAELVRGNYRLMRPALLHGWREAWELELLLRIYGHTKTPRSSRPMRDYGYSTLLIGKGNLGELGAVGDLFPEYTRSKRWGVVRKKLQGFTEKLAARSEPHELHATLREPTRAGWTLEVSYPELPPEKPRRIRAGTRRAVRKLTAGTPQLAPVGVSLGTASAPMDIAQAVVKWHTLTDIVRKGYAKGYGTALRDALSVSGVPARELSKYFGE